MTMHMYLSRVLVDSEHRKTYSENQLGQMLASCEDSARERIETADQALDEAGPGGPVRQVAALERECALAWLCLLEADNTPRPPAESGGTPNHEGFLGMEQPMQVFMLRVLTDSEYRRAHSPGQLGAVLAECEAIAREELKAAETIMDRVGADSSIWHAVALERECAREWLRQLEAIEAPRPAMDVDGKLIMPSSAPLTLSDACEYSDLKELCTEAIRKLASWCRRNAHPMPISTMVEPYCDLPDEVWAGWWARRVDDLSGEVGEWDVWDWANGLEGSVD